MVLGWPREEGSDWITKPKAGKRRVRRVFKRKASCWSRLLVALVLAGGVMAAAMALEHSAPKDPVAALFAVEK